MTRSSSVLPSRDIGPMTTCHPLLKPGFTILISSYWSGPFSVSHKVWVIGSIPNPKLFLMPYAQYLDVVLSFGNGFPSGALPLFGFMRIITLVSSGSDPSVCNDKDKK